ncbi:glycosyltransferase [Macrococcus animalis]|uniref:glycosyltransferase n=1 Tax=Macrococcus animalis TaxID=3395467 RepID=UPI0039BF43A2
MKLSIIIPVYNVEQYLPDCIESLIKQDIDPELYEMIIVNDASPDNSLKIAEDYQKQYPNIKIISQQNGGIASARNTGIKAATGEYLVMLDSDDFYSKVFFKDIFEFIAENNNPDIVLFDFNYYYMLDERQERVQRSFKPSDFKGLTGLQAVEMILDKELMFSWYAWPFFVKTDLIKQNDLYFVKNKNYEDMMWVPVVFAKANKIAYFDKAVLEYRQQRAGQITGTMSYKNIVDPLDAPKIVDEQLKRCNIQLSEEADKKLKQNIANKYFIAFIYGALLNRNERNQLVEALKSHEHLRQYSSTQLTKRINTLISSIGIKNTLKLFSIVLPIYRKFKGK